MRSFSISISTISILGMLLTLHSCKSKEARIADFKKGLMESCKDKTNPNTKIMVEAGIEVDQYCDCVWSLISSDEELLDNMIFNTKQKPDDILNEKVMKDDAFGHSLEKCVLDNMRSDQ